LILAVFVPPDIYWITNFVGPMFAAVWGPVAFMSVWSKRITEAGAFWGMLAGFVSFVGSRALITFDVLALPAILNPILVGFVLSLVTTVLVSLRTTVTAPEIAYRDALHDAPPELDDAPANRSTIRWPTIVMGWGVASTLILLVVYVRPYQLASGLLSADGPYVTVSGELYFALAFGAYIFLAGAIARYFILRLDQAPAKDH
jgi:sodium/pantothenate symporter